MFIAIVPVVFAVMGALVWALSAPGSRWGEFGRLVMLAGLIAIAIAYSGKVVQLP